MFKKLEFKKDDHHVDYQKLRMEINELTIAAEHIVRVNGSSAFPMPKAKKKTFWDRFSLHATA